MNAGRVFPPGKFDDVQSGPVRPDVGRSGYCHSPQMAACEHQYVSNGGWAPHRARASWRRAGRSEQSTWEPEAFNFRQ